MPWFISRQRYYDENRQLAVEIAEGSKKASPDILVFRYDGEGKNFLDPRVAAKKAIEIYKSWMLSCSDELIELRILHADGGKYFFNEKGINALNRWAEKVYNTMSRCGNCTALLGKKDGITFDGLSGQFCDEACCARKYRDIYHKEPVFSKK